MVGKLKGKVRMRQKMGLAHFHGKTKGGEKTMGAGLQRKGGKSEGVGQGMRRGRQVARWCSRCKQGWANRTRGVAMKGSRFHKEWCGLLLGWAQGST